jgi:GR25 family glycosyltransferase involved in LPS biosynthesis
MERKNILILLLFVLILILIKKSHGSSETANFIKNYSLMVYLKNNEISDKRMEGIKEIWKTYGVFPNLYHGLNAKNPEHINIIKTLPIERNNKPFDNRIGAYGLAGSFYKMLVKAYDTDLPYFLFMEDDAIPILKPNDFNKVFIKALKNIPDEEGCYSLGVSIFCKYNQPLTKKWERVNNIKTENWGCTAVLFTRKSLKRILDYIHKNKINEPIDHTVKKVYGDSLYYWNDNISESGMFIGLFEQYETYCDKRVSVIDSL